MGGTAADRAEPVIELLRRPMRGVTASELRAEGSEAARLVEFVLYSVPVSTRSEAPMSAGNTVRAAPAGRASREHSADLDPESQTGTSNRQRAAASDSLCRSMTCFPVRPNPSSPIKGHKRSPSVTAVEIEDI